MKPRFGKNVLAAGLLAVALSASPAAEAAVTPVQMSSGDVGISVWDTDTTKVGVAMQIVNAGSAAAEDVVVTSVALSAGSYQGPQTLPLALGSIGAGEDTLLNLIVKVPASNGSNYRITVSGTYRYAGKAYGYAVNRTIAPAPSPTVFPVSHGTAVVQNPNAVAYPPQPAPADFGPNAESPVLVPIGPPRLVFPPTPTGTTLGPSTGGASVEIPVNTRSSGNSALIPPDPNAAAQGGTNGVVVSTYNASGTGKAGAINYSVDGGATFTEVSLSDAQPGNPARTSFFPQSDGGLCCDQVVVFLPQQNLFVWLLQYNPVTSAGKITQSPRLRVAWASPAAIKANFWNAWTYADLTGISVANVSGGLGIAANEWLDYPDLAWSGTFLYVGIDHGNTTPGKVYTGRRIVARMSLADIANPGAGTVHYDYAELTGSSGLNKTHFVQGAPGQMVVGSLDNSSQLRVFTWSDTSATIPAPSTIGISQINQTNYTAPAPDGVDWLAVSFPGNITGAAYIHVPANPGGGLFGAPTPEQNLYTFAFDAGSNGSGRPQAYVRLETVAASGTNYTASSEYDVWNASYAYAMAALGSSGNELGITLAVGGGSLGYPQEAVGFRNDFVVFQATASNATQGARFGDYLSNRIVSAQTVRFGTEVYDVTLNAVPPGSAATCAAVGCQTFMRYVEYQRPLPTQTPIK